MLESLGLAAGVLVANWVVLPLIAGKTYKEAFTIGVFFALLVLGFFAMI